MKNKFLAVIFLFILSPALKSQYIGAQLGASYLLGVKLMPGIGVHFTPLIFNQPFSFGLNYHLPFKIEDYDYADPIDWTGSQIKVSYTDKVNMFDFHFYWRYYFGDNSLEDGGWYAFPGVCLGIAHVKTTPGPYDATKYRLSSNFDQTSTLFVQPYITLGIGYEKVLDNDHQLGFQFLLNLNSTNYNSRTGAAGDPVLPSMVGLRATYSLPLGN